MNTHSLTDLELLIIETVSIKPHGISTIVERVHECSKTYHTGTEIKIAAMQLYNKGHLHLNSSWEFHQ